MNESIFRVTLRNGLDPEAPILKLIGEAKTADEADKLAMAYINDKKNLRELGCKSLYVRGILFSETSPICTGLDYGSYSRFVFIKEEMA